LNGSSFRLTSAPRLSAILPVCAIVLSTPLQAGPPATGEFEVLSGSDSMTVEVHLERLGPLTPAMRAILAFYAMRANGGCPPGTWSEDGKTYDMQCPLTTALGLGRQCSEAQLALVKTWFKDGIPAVNLDQADAANIGKSGDFASACNATPYTATHQSIWSSLRVRQEKKGLVTITGEGSWTSGPEAGGGSFTDVTTYRILPDRVRVVRHRGTSAGD